MTACSVSVLHNATASNAIRLLTEHFDHEFRYVLSVMTTTGLTAGIKPEGLTGSPLEAVLTAHSRDNTGKPRIVGIQAAARAI